jgi:DNA-binding transcriptional ArsR family regulator
LTTLPNTSGARHDELVPIGACATIFAALGDETRLSVLTKLAKGQPQSISRLTSGTSLSRQAVSRHLRVLEQAGIVESVRVGRESRFQFLPGSTADASRYLKLVSQQWDDALGRLKSFVESPADRQLHPKPVSKSLVRHSGKQR